MFREIHPIARPVIDPQLRDAFTNRFDITRIPSGQTFDPYLHTRPRSYIRKPIKPAGKCLSLSNAKHAEL